MKEEVNFNLVKRYMIGSSRKTSIAHSETTKIIDLEDNYSQLEIARLSGSVDYTQSTEYCTSPLLHHFCMLTAVTTATIPVLATFGAGFGLCLFQKQIFPFLAAQIIVMLGSVYCNFACFSYLCIVLFTTSKPGMEESPVPYSQSRLPDQHLGLNKSACWI